MFVRKVTLVGGQYFVQEFDGEQPTSAFLPVLRFLFDEYPSSEECMRYLSIDRECAEVVDVDGDLCVRCEVCNAFVFVKRRGLVEGVDLMAWLEHKFSCPGTKLGFHFV